MTRKLTLFIALMLLLAPLTAFAQFGQNLVKWQNEEWYGYESEHFNFLVGIDLKSEEILPHFNAIVSHIENSNEFLSANLKHRFSKNRPIVIITGTHWRFEALSLSGGDMSEGVGAYAFPRISKLASDMDLVLVIKPDFFPKLNQTIYTHELAHLFQFDMLGTTLFQRLTGRDPIDHWIYEATADYMANNFTPYTTDEIRKINQRAAAVNVKNPQFGLPTLEMCQMGQANPYVECKMVFDFLEARFGKERVSKLIADIFGSKKKLKFTEWLEEISNGEFPTDEAFDRAHRDYWISIYGEDRLKRPQPYSNTTSVNGRQIVQQTYQSYPHPYPFKTPVVSRDGKYVAFLTANQKSGVVLAIARTLPRENPPYIPLNDRKKRKLFIRLVKTEPGFKVVTEYIPPKPYQYIIGQKLETWTFNGSDIDWWQDSEWISKVKVAESGLENGRQKLVVLKSLSLNNRTDDHVSRVETIEKLNGSLEKDIENFGRVPNVSRIVFFARYNRDHALFIKDMNTGKLSKPIEVPLDQGFSPKFSPDGKTVYFSAAKNINRDIYSLNLETKELIKQTSGNEAFNSAPSISPDGTKIAYVAFPKGSDFQKLFILDLATGVNGQLTYGRFNDNSPSWSSDGSTLVYTSDEKDEIWNLYTLDLATNTSKQWTEIPGGIFTPVFSPEENDRVVFSGFFDTDQFHSYILSNYKLFDVRLKEPLRVVEVKPSDMNMQIAFRSEEIISRQLDQQQIQPLVKPPARWKLYGSQIQLGYSSYYGGYVFTQMVAQNLLADKTHVGTYAQNGYFRYVDYTYYNQTRRWPLAVNGNFSRSPLAYNLYNYNGQLPRYPKSDGDSNQFILNSTWVQEMSATLFTQYPFDKFRRVEFGIRPRQRKFLLPFEVSVDQRQNFVDQFPQLDIQFYDLFSNASKTNLGLVTAFVHDTVIGSNEAEPLHGLAFRGQVEYGPALNSRSAGYTTASFDARRYFRLANSTSAAFRGVGMTSTRKSGDFMLFGGTDTLGPYSYSSIAGNQVIYGRGDLRFPFADIVLGGMIPVDVRGVLFADGAKVKFNHDLFPTRTEWSYGLAFQTRIFLPLEFGIARTRFSPNKFTPYVRIGVSF